MGDLTHCTCGNDEAEQDRGAVLNCPIHGANRLRQYPEPVEARVEMVTIPAADWRGAVEALERIAAIKVDVELSPDATAARHEAALRNAVEIARAIVGGR